MHQVLEPLTVFAADGSVRPFLAESVEPNGTYDRWAIRVRKNITFQNGQALDAEAVKRNLDLHATGVAKADPFKPIVSTSVVDDRTVSVELSTSWPSFPAYLTGEIVLGLGLIVSAETIETSGARFVTGVDIERLFGTGPFVFDPQESTPERWVGRRNPKYWQSTLPHLDKVEMQVIPDARKRTEGLIRGDLDAAITSDRAIAGVDLGEFSVVRQRGDGQDLAVALNMLRPPLDDPRMREALVLAADTTALAESEGVNTAEIIIGPYHRDSKWYSPVSHPQRFDLERAKKLVAEHEQEHGAASIQLSSWGVETEDLAVQQKLADQWAKTGVDVQVVDLSQEFMIAALYMLGQYDAVMSYFPTAPTDPDMNHYWWHSAGSRTQPGKLAAYNFVGVADPNLDRALDDLRSRVDDEGRRKAVAQVQEHLAANNPYVWLWSRSWIAVAAKRVHGLDETPTVGGGTRPAIYGRRLDFANAWVDN